MKKTFLTCIIINILIFNLNCQFTPIVLDYDNSTHPEAKIFNLENEENTDLICKALNKELDYANAAWWGFDKNDSTEFLQKAISSGINKLIIPNMGTPWNVNPLFLESNMEIVFESGTVIQAIKGAYLNKGDSLFTAADKQNIVLSGYGAVWIMHKEDYMVSPYEDSQWRDTLQIQGCKNIKIYGITMKNSGGDGIYIRRGNENREGYLSYSEGIYIKDVILDGHYRQGISVISCQDLLIENTIIINTYGHNPEAGIDFEPNLKTERLVNCIIENCTIINNAGSGIMIHLGQFDSRTIPVSIILESNDLTGNKRSVFIGATSGNPHGIININNNMIDSYHIQESENLKINIKS
jgi:hypothetical protein